jgi:hypothetical protein
MPLEDIPIKHKGADVITELMPWKYFSIHEMKAGRIPFWNPYNFSGNIHMQNFQSGIFNPLNVVFFILPFTTAWSFFILFQPLLASFFMYVFLKDLRLSNWGSAIGAVAFAFSSYMTVWMEYGNIATTLLWLPLLLFLVQRFILQRKVRYYFWFVISTSLMMLAGYIQGAFYVYLTVSIYALYLLFQEKKRSVGFLMSLISLGVFPPLLTSFQLFPTLSVFASSTRGSYSLSQIQTLLQPLYYWITLFSSDFFGNPATRNYFLTTTYIERVCYVGIPMLFFVFLAFLKKIHPQKNFFLILGIVIGLMATNLPFIAYIYKIPIAVLSTTVPTRILSIFIFSFIVVGVMGIDFFFKEKIIPKKAFIAFFFLLYSALDSCSSYSTLSPSVHSGHVNYKKESLLFFSYCQCDHWNISFWKEI